MTEEWRDVVGYDGRYQVSSIGNVRNANKLLALHNDLHGYPIVILTKDKVRKTWTVHKLVALAFIEEVPDKPIINHKDGVKTNNAVSNLEWVTHAENLAHARHTGLWKPSRGERQHRSKLTTDTVNWIRAVYVCRSADFGCTALATKLGVVPSVISEAIRGKTWAHV